MILMQVGEPFVQPNVDPGKGSAGACIGPASRVGTDGFQGLGMDGLQGGRNGCALQFPKGCTFFPTIYCRMVANHFPSDCVNVAEGSTLNTEGAVP